MPLDVRDEHRVVQLGGELGGPSRSFCASVSEGIRTVRLPFPGGPVRSFQEVTDGLRVLLTCRCGTCGHRTAER